MVELFVLLAFLNNLSSASPAPNIDVISPTTTLWTESNNVEFDISITDSAPTYTFIDWQDSLVGWWRGEGDMSDASRFENHAQCRSIEGLQPGYLWPYTISPSYTPGRFGQAFSIANALEWIDLGDADELDFEVMDSFTVALWVKLTGPQDARFVQKEGGWSIQRRLGGYTFYVGTRQRRSSSIDLSSWTHIAVVYDGKAPNLFVYTNGLPDSAWAEGSYPTTIRSAKSLRIGQVEGCFDEILVFNRVLSSGEIAALYSVTAGNLQTTFADIAEMVEHDYVAYAVNAAGDSNSVSGTIMVDTPDSAPEVTVVSPLTPYRSSDSSQTFTISARNTNSGTTLASAQLYWDYGQEWGPVGDPVAISGQTASVSFEKAGLTEGAITWNIMVSDSDNNHAFSLDNHTLIVTSQTDYYVAVNGDDSNPGTIDQPFRTIQRFADIALPGDTCWIREGTYREMVTPANSGNATAPITFKAYPHETVTISGADIIDDVWTVHDGAIYMTTAMDWDLGLGNNQVFVDGAVMMEARWPNCDDVTQPNWSVVESATKHGTYDWTIGDSDLPAVSWEGAIWHGAWGYYAFTGTVTQSGTGSVRITAHTTNVAGFSWDHQIVGGSHYLIGALAALDTAGEWFYDGATLYLWAPGDLDPTVRVVEAKRREHAFDLSAKSYITIEGMDIVGANITTDRSSQCITIDNVNARHISHYWALAGPADPVSGHQSGIRLLGSNHILRDSTILYSAGYGVVLGGDNMILQNCEVGYANYSASSAYAVGSGGKTRNNQLLDSRIHSSGRSLLGHSYAQNMKILRNEFYNSNYAGELSDLGALYAIDTDGKGTEIAYNKIHGIYYAGIYLDSNCRNMWVHHNVVYRGVFHWRYPHYPHAVLMNGPAENNIFQHNTFETRPGKFEMNVGGRSYAGSRIENCVGHWIVPHDGGELTEEQIFNLIPGLVLRNCHNTRPELGDGRSPYKVYVNYDADDFRLRAGTEETPNPARNAGLQLVYSHDIMGNPHNSPPDLGACQYWDGSAPSAYTLNVTTSHGVVNKSPDETVYNYGETVTLQAVANDGYVFVGWAGDLSGRANPAQIVMNGRKFVTARFAEISTNTYSLHTTSTYGGSIVRTPDKTDFRPGETVTLRAVPLGSYTFGGWSGSHSGLDSEITITMDGPKLIAATFGTGYTLQTSATNGYVTKTPDKALYVPGEQVTLLASPQSGYAFTGWSGDLSGGLNPTSITMDSDKAVTATFASTVAPTVVNCSPGADAIQVPINSLISLGITDADPGVDANTVTIAVNGATVYSGNVASYSSAHGVCRRTGTKNAYAYAFQSSSLFDFDRQVDVLVTASDLSGNAMSPHSYSFRTEMRSFGANRIASWGAADLDKSRSATVRDSSGNIWVVYHAGPPGTRDVYIAKLVHGSESFGISAALTSGTADHAYPDVAIGSDDQLTVVWQDNRRGTWDIYIRTSADGVTWSAEMRVTESDDNQTRPAIAADPQSSAVWVAWQDDGADHHDIYVARSTDGFTTKTISQVTAHASHQIDPKIALTASGTAYLVWTDQRNGSDDVYAAASNVGPWMNVAAVVGPGNQSAPALAVEAAGSRLHLAWVDDASDSRDIHYATSDGLPGSPLVGINVVDDLSGADQIAPTIATVGSTGAGLKVFVAWQDYRNYTNGRDTDLYFIEFRAGPAANILVGDARSNADQTEPALGIDLYGYPYLVWTDHRNVESYIFYAASTFMAPSPLQTQLVTASAGGTVGVTPPVGLDDVSIVVPVGACPHDVTLAIRPIENPPWSSIMAYDFGPSGLQFNVPVILTIPYLPSHYGDEPPIPYWYNSQTGMVSQQGITVVDDLELGPDLRALRFTVTHFTPYYLLPGDGSYPGDPGDGDGSPDGGGGGGGGGGGCSLASSAQSNPLEFFAPYLLLAVVMAALRLRDRRRHSHRS